MVCLGEGEELMSDAIFSEKNRFLLKSLNDRLADIQTQFFFLSSVFVLCKCTSLVKLQILNKLFFIGRY